MGSAIKVHMYRPQQFISLIMGLYLYAVTSLIKKELNFFMITTVEKKIVAAGGVWFGKFVRDFGCKQQID